MPASIETELGSLGVTTIVFNGPAMMLTLAVPEIAFCVAVTKRPDATPVCAVKTPLALIEPPFVVVGDESEAAMALHHLAWRSRRNVFVLDAAGAVVHRRATHGRALRRQDAQLW